MNKRNKIIVSIVGITIVLLALLGITYAYYLTRIQGNTNTNSISITTADLKLEYRDGNGLIELSGVMPGDSITKTFTVENIGENKVTGYTIVIENVINELSRREDLKYSLYCTLDDGTSCGKSENNLYPKTKNIAIIYSNDIDSGVKHNYELVINYIYLDTVDQSDDMGSTISGKINIYDAKDEKLNPFSTGVTATDNKSLAYNIIENARLGKNGTTLMGTSLSMIGRNPSGKVFDIKTNETSATSMAISESIASFYWTYGDGYIVDEKNGITLTGVKTCIYKECYDELAGKYLISNVANKNSYKENVERQSTGLSIIYRIDAVGATYTSSPTLTKISITTKEIDETILATTIDDYGTTYYYRGNVINNYVNFAGMCWRIVRIVGNGTIRLILEDQNVTCNSDSYTGEWSLGSGTFGYYLDDYENEILYSIDSVNSNISNSFKTFQKDKLNDYLDKMVYGNWCYDLSPYSDENGYSRILDLTSYYSNNTDFYYGAYTRMMQEINPTLKCMGNMIENYGKTTDETEATKMYVSTLTVDEVAHAGSIENGSSIDFYLKNDSALYWWTLSPDGLISKKEGAFILTSTGGINNVDVSEEHYYRPAINLKSDITITGGEGTKSSPYVIE